MTTNEVFEKVKSDFNFDVEKFPLFGPDGMKTSFYGLFRSDTSECVGKAVSQRYEVYQTDDVLAITEAASKVFGEGMTVKTHFRDGHFVSIAPPDSYRRQIFGTSDNVFPRCVVRAGYDGRAFKTSLGFFRDLCSNLHIPSATDIAHSVNIRHSSKLRTFMKELIADFQLLGDSWESMTKQIKFMQNRDVQIVNFLNQVYDSPEEGNKRAETIHKNRTESILRRLINERQKSGRGQIDESGTVSAWEAFNAVQGFVQHDASRKQNFRNEMDRILLASRDAHVQRAERLALAV